MPFSPVLLRGREAPKSSALPFWRKERQRAPLERLADLVRMDCRAPVRPYVGESLSRSPSYALFLRRLLWKRASAVVVIRPVDASTARQKPSAASQLCCRALACVARGESLLVASLPLNETPQRGTLLSCLRRVCRPANTGLPGVDSSWHSGSCAESTKFSIKLLLRFIKSPAGSNATPGASRSPPAPRWAPRSSVPQFPFRWKRFLPSKWMSIGRR